MKLDLIFCLSVATFSSTSYGHYPLAAYHLLPLRASHALVRLNKDLNLGPHD